MGIYKFGTWIESVDKNVPEGETHKRLTNARVPPDVGCLFLDMNGIFHNAAQMVYVYAKGDPDKKEFKSEFGKNQDVLKKQQERKKLLSSKTDKELEVELYQEIISKIMEIIDTINPSDYVVLAVDGVAPMAKITQQRKRRYEGSKDSKSGSRFDSNCITPGTEFMNNLDSVIQSFIAHCVKTNQFRVKNIVYSSHLTRGEGEHKIFDVVRKKHITPDLTKNNIVYGKDADLFMLTLLSDIPYLYLCREDYKMTYNIDALRNYLSRYMTNDDFQPDIKQVCRDFVLLIFLVGNDFVPNTIYFYDVKMVINHLIDTYVYTEKILTNENGEIIWENFGEFLKIFSKKEVKYLTEMAAKLDSYDYPFPILEACVKKEKSKNELLETFEYKVKVDIEKYKKLWYERALSPMSSLGKEIFPFEITSKDVDMMCIEYLKTFQWIMQYYTKGQKAVSSRFVYIYHFNPLISDIAEILTSGRLNDKLPKYEDVMFSSRDPIITPIHQLIAVMPPPSWKLIPEPYRTLMPIRFMDICPTEFEKLIEAKVEKDKYISTAILNIVDPVRIDRDIEDVPVPAKYKEQPNKFIVVHKVPKAPRGYVGLKNEMKRLELQKLEELPRAVAAEQSLTMDRDPLEEPLPPEDLFNIDYDAKVEPKSAAQMERIIRNKIKTRTLVKKEIKANKPINVLWTTEALM